MIDSLPLIWGVVIAVAVVVYTILDGFDLGVGVLFAAEKSEQHRDVMMNSVAPFWDGNETWLVLGGGGLFVAFPLAYSIIMPAFYIPVIVMLLALIFRGVAFEFRHVAKPHHHWWDKAFLLGSLCAAFSQGVILGGLLQGVTVVDNRFAGGTFDWLTPFSLFCGAGVVVGYTTLAACWLNMKTEGELQIKMQRLALWLLLGMLLFIIGVSIWTPLAFPEIAEKWFSLPNFYFLWPVPTITGVLAFSIYYSLKKQHAIWPFLGTAGLFVVSFVGLAFSTLPLIVPPDISVYHAAAAHESQLFSIIGVLILMPVILIYTGFVYYIFRGKVTAESGYH